MTPNSTWHGVDYDGSVLKLETCPYGYLAVSINVKVVEASAQELEIRRLVPLDRDFTVPLTYKSC